MDMNGSQRIEASREKVYAALNDVEVLRQCIPGCESIEKTSDNEMNAKVTLCGPVASFTGRCFSPISTRRTATPSPVRGGRHGRICKGQRCGES
jgi:carbon monoxide dehydrogenase subunit G